ncbi:hypothetical protein Tco_0623762, partial [Tanacetum coccineum]
LEDYQELSKVGSVTFGGSKGSISGKDGGCQFLGRRLISWQCKKQTIVATSTTEAEYVAAASCKLLWSSAMAAKLIIGL